MNMNRLFFELIQVAIGTRNCLSHTPSVDEWGELYAMAKKQSLIGICFAAVQRLPEDVRPSEMLYLTWMGMAAKIQQKNEMMKAKGDRLLSELRKDGMDACILKGQSVASLYKVLDGFNGGQVSSDLSFLRQSGDIDVWVKNRSVMELDAYVKELGLKPHTTAAHVSYEDKDGVEIELHADPAFFRSFRNDRILKKWFKEFNDSSFDSAKELGGNVSTVEFNLVYMMVHMYHHVLFEGLGLRQLMDYYFVLRTVEKSKECRECIESICSKQPSIPSVLSVLDNFGMKKFASGIMWIMKEVFAFEDRYLICEVSEKYGRLILEDVMTGGNFGHHDEKNKGLHGGTAVGRSFSGLKRNMKFFALGPWEILSSPEWSTWHWIWRKRRGLL